jgi:predicted TIM-barrel fold metal-dependent hydrolase
MKERVVSSDSHVMEPADLWTARLDNKLKEQSPKVVKNEGQPGYSFVAPGVYPFPVAAIGAIGKSGDELKEHLTKGYEAARPGGWDPAERLKDQDIDGVEAEVLYTSLGMPLFSLPDTELQRACFKVYNDWLAEFASYAPKRLYPIALISLDDVAVGVREMEQCVKQGHRGVQICGVAPPERPYLSPDYDPFWTAAQEMQIPISLHLGTGRKSMQGQAASGRGVRLTGRDFMINTTLAPVHEIQRSLCTLIFGNVLERFPRLRIVSAENDSGWFPHMLYRLDHFYEKFGTMSDEMNLSMKPSDYVRRNVWVTFQDDMVGPMTWKLFGEDRYMWASDFPHSDSTWPNSLKVIERNFEGVPESVKRKIVYSNAASLYRMELD